jgi:hypothetical protein
MFTPQLLYSGALLFFLALTLMGAFCILFGLGLLGRRW